MLLCVQVPSFTLLGMFKSIMISNECALTFADCVVYVNKSMNYDICVDLECIKECIAAIPSVSLFAIWRKEEDTEFDDFII